MENNKILFLTISILIYALLSTFVGKIITTKFRKKALVTDSFNNYAIIFSGFLVSVGILGNQSLSILNDVFEILQKNNAATSQYFTTVALFIGSAIVISVFVYYFSFVLFKIIFDKTKIAEYSASNQYGYFLLFAVFIIVFSLVSIPLYHDLLILFSPKIEAGLYN